METKSRYEVISDLENKKRELIRERDKLDEDSKDKERKVKNLERTKEDISKSFFASYIPSQPSDFSFSFCSRR